MPTLVREDGTQFAVYTYRETLSGKSAAVLRREAMALARENGQYTRFFPIETGEVEAIFSRDPGYLLAETVWQHFGNPPDLLYCETLEGTDNALLVVIRGGSVYLDAELPIVNLVDEFLALSTGENRYAIYIHGDVPLAEISSDEKFAFDPMMVDTFTDSPEPIFPTLALDPDFKLLDVDGALSAIRLPSGGLAKNLIILVFLAIVAYLGWLMIKPSTPVIEQVSMAPVQPPEPVNPYADYQSQLMSPAPATILREVITDVQMLMTIPGWTTKSMNFNGQRLSFDLQQDGGDAALLLAWVKNHPVAFEMANGHAAVSFALTSTNRGRSDKIYNLRETVAQLYDDLSHILPGDKISIGAATQKTNYKQVELTVTFSTVTLGILALIASELENFPVIMSSCSLTVDTGIVSGTMQLQVLGV